jgi:hypothetical protein
MENQINKPTDVLAKYARQPKIYLTLPSGGRFYAENPMEKSGSGELPIYSMTAKDELGLKTPDALLNGEATVQMIKNCCPLIDDPWSIPQIDIDAIIVAIRIATYGEKMTAGFNIPVVNEEMESEIDLRTVLDQLQGHTYENDIHIGDLTFHIVPLTYKHQTELYQQTLETQRMAQVLGDDKLSEEEKLRVFKEGFKKLASTRLHGVAKQVVAIKTPEGEETNPQKIASFLDALGAEEFDVIAKHIDAQRAKFEVKPQSVKVPDIHVKNGAPSETQIPIMFDQANFFVSR